MEITGIENTEKILKTVGFSKFFEYDKNKEAFYSKEFTARNGLKARLKLTQHKAGKHNDLVRDAKIWKLFDFFKGEDMLLWDEHNRKMEESSPEKGKETYYRSGTFIKLQLNGLPFLIQFGSDDDCTVQQVPDGQKSRCLTLAKAINFILLESKDKKYKKFSDAFDDELDFLHNNCTVQWKCEVKFSDGKPYHKYWWMTEHTEWAYSFLQAFQMTCTSEIGCEQVEKDDGTITEFPLMEIHYSHRHGDSFPVRYVATGAYKDLILSKCWLRNVFEDNTYVTTIPYNKGDVIGRGYCKMEVLKPFNGYIVYEDFKEKLHQTWGTHVIIPAFDGCVEISHCSWHLYDILKDDRENFDEKKVFEATLLNYVNNVNGRDNDYDKQMNEEKIKEHLSYKRVNCYLVNYDANDSVLDYDYYEEDNIEESFFGSNLEKVYKRPDGLLEFIRSNLKLGDFVEYKLITQKEIDKYEKEVYRHIGRYNSDKQHEEYRTKWLYEFGDEENEKRFPLVYKAFRNAGFNPPTHKEALKLIEKNEKLLKKQDEDEENAYKRKVLKNIAKLTADEKNAILTQWMNRLDQLYANNKKVNPFRSSKLYNSSTDDEKIFLFSNGMNTFNDSKKLTVNGTNIFFDKEMKKRKPSILEEHFMTFVQCLKDNGFKGTYSDEEKTLSMRADVIDEVTGENTRRNLKRIKKFYEVPNYYDDREHPGCLDFHVKMKDYMIELQSPNLDMDGHVNCEETHFFDQRDDSFLNVIKRFVEEKGNNRNINSDAKYDSDFDEWDERLHATYYGAMGEHDGEVQTRIMKVACDNKFVKVCKDFLKAIGKDESKKSSKNSYKNTSDTFLQCLRDHGFEFENTDGEFDAVKSVLNLIPPKWKGSFNEKNTTYHVIVSKKDKYGDRSIGIRPMHWERDRMLLGTTMTFNSNGNSFVETVKNLLEMMDGSHSNDLYDYMKKLEGDTRQCFDVSIAEKQVEETNKRFNFNHLTEQASYKDFYDVLIDFIGRIGETWKPEK